MPLCIMEFLLIISISLISIAYSEMEIDIRPFVPSTVCYNCEDEVNNTVCNQNNATTCDIGESCQNAVVDNDAFGIHLLYKKCVDFYECSYGAGIGCTTNTTTNTTTCLYCCIGELCNVNEAVALVVPDFMEIIYQTLIYEHANRQLVLNIALGIITLVCLASASISIVTSGLGSKTAPFVHINLCFSWFFSQLLIMLRSTGAGNENACKLLAFLIQYFYVAGACHFTLEGVHLLFTVARNSLSVWKKWKMVLIGWGTPFIISVITIVTSREGYGMPSGLQKYCWLSYKVGSWWGLFIPVAVVIFFAIVCIIVIAVLRKRVKDDSDESKCKKFRSNYIAFSIVAIAYTATFLCAFMELDPFQTTVPYIFFTVHALLGILVSVFYCPLNYEVKLVIKAKIWPN